MRKFEGLEFEALPVRTLADERVRVTAMSRSRFKLTFNAPAYQRLGKPDALRVDFAERDGARFVRIAPAELGGGLARV